MACNIPICIYIKFDIVNARLELVVGGVVAPVAQLKLMPAYNQYVQQFNNIRAAHMNHFQMQCDPQCHCAKASTKPVARNVPVPAQVLDSGNLPPAAPGGAPGAAWVVQVTGITLTLWIGICLPTGAKIKDGNGWKPAETWGPGWEIEPVDTGAPIGGAGGSKPSGSKGGKKKKKGGKKRRMASGRKSGRPARRR